MGTEGTEGAEEQRNSGYRGTEEQRNSGFRGTEGSVVQRVQRNRRYRGTIDHLGMGISNFVPSSVASQLIPL